MTRLGTWTSMGSKDALGPDGFVTSPSGRLAYVLGSYQSLHNSHTLPPKSCNPSLLGGYDMTGAVLA